VAKYPRRTYEPDYQFIQDWVDVARKISASGVHVLVPDALAGHG